MKARITSSVSTNTNDRNSDRGASCGTDSTIYPVGRLVGHDGPIQAVVFTGTFDLLYVGKMHLVILCMEEWKVVDRHHTNPR